MGPGQAGDPAWVSWPGLGWDGRPPQKMYFLGKNVVLGPFWPFLDLLDLKNGTGSKFYTGKWYSEVWKRKIKLFHEKTTNSYLT